MKDNQSIALLLSLILAFSPLYTQPLHAGAFLIPPSENDEKLLEDGFLNRRNLLKLPALGAIGLALAPLEEIIEAATSKDPKAQAALEELQKQNYASAVAAINTVLKITDPKELKEFIDRIFYYLLGTPRHESVQLIFRRQLNGGPARGLWQIEPKTAIDIIKRVLLPIYESYHSKDQFVLRPIERKYIVQSGDTLSGISKKFYGKTSKYTDIKKYNNLKSDVIHPNQELRIPDFEPVYGKYTIQEKDLPEILQGQFSHGEVKWKTIAQFNKLDEKTVQKLKPGDILNIPTIEKRPEPLLVHLAKSVRLTPEELIKKCDSPQEIGNLLETNDVFSCFIARIIYKERADDEIRKTPGRKDLEKILAKELGRTPTTEEIEKRFAEFVAEIWQKNYNCSKVNPEGKKKAFAEAMLDGTFPDFASKIPPLYVSILNPSKLAITDMPYSEKTRRIAIGAAIGAVALVALSKLTEEKTVESFSVAEARREKEPNVTRRKFARALICAL